MADNKDRAIMVLKHLTAAAASDAISKICAAPLMRVKILLQVQHTSTQLTPDGHYAGFLDCVRRVTREQGFASLWRGAPANLLSFYPITILDFVFSGIYKRIFMSKVEEENHLGRFLAGFAAGAAAGLSTFFFVYPLHFAYNRLAADVGVDGQREFTGVGHCIMTVLRSDGPTGLYRGFLTSVQGIIVYRAAFFGLYDLAKNHLLKNCQGNILLQFLVANLITIGAGIMSYPFDTVRARLMMQSGRKEDQVMYRGAVDCWHKIAVQEGCAGFFKGLFVNILRGTCGAVLLVVFDELKNSR